MADRALVVNARPLRCSLILGHLPTGLERGSHQATALITKTPSWKISNRTRSAAPKQTALPRGYENLGPSFQMKLSWLSSKIGAQRNGTPCVGLRVERIAAAVQSGKGI